jgi:hypothetical protein
MSSRLSSTGGPCCTHMLGSAVLMNTAVGETVDIPPTTLTSSSCLMKQIRSTEPGPFERARFHLQVDISSYECRNPALDVISMLMDTAVGETINIPPTTLTRNSCLMKQIRSTGPGPFKRARPDL